MPRSTWKGALSCAVFNAPVKLYKAQDGNTGVKLNLVHGKCNTKIKQKRWCEVCEDEVPYGDLIKGFPVSDEQMVTFTPEEMDSIAVKSNKTMEVEGFLPEGQQPDSIYYDESYYMAPDDVGFKPFALLMEVMRNRGLVALTKLTLRTREHMALVRPMEDGRVLLTTLHWGDEVRDDPEYYELLGIKPPISDRERELANVLLDGMETEFDPTQTRDEYRENFNSLVQAKLAGEIIQIPQEERAATSPANMESVLEAAVAAVKAKTKTSKKRRKS